MNLPKLIFRKLTQKLWFSESVEVVILQTLQSLTKTEPPTLWQNSWRMYERIDRAAEALGPLIRGNLPMMYQTH